MTFHPSSEKVDHSVPSPPDEDHIKVDIDFKVKPNFIFTPLFGMYVTPNLTYIGYNYSDYPKSSLFKIFQNTQLRASLGWKKSLSFHQFFKKWRGIDIEYREELSTRNLGLNSREIKRESSLVFHKRLQDPSFFFPFFAFTDDSEELYAQIGYKRRRNDIDVTKASAEFMKNAFNQDNLFFFKVGYLSNQFTNLSFDEGKCLDVSAEF